MSIARLRLHICAACGRDIAQVCPSFNTPGMFVVICDPILGGCGRLCGFYETEGAALDGWNARNAPGFGPVGLEVVA